MTVVDFSNGEITNYCNNCYTTKYKMKNNGNVIVVDLWRPYGAYAIEHTWCQIMVVIQVWSSVKGAIYREFVSTSRRTHWGNAMVTIPINNKLMWIDSVDEVLEIFLQLRLLADNLGVRATCQSNCRTCQSMGKEHIVLNVRIVTKASCILFGRRSSISTWKQKQWSINFKLR